MKRLLTLILFCLTTLQFSYSQEAQEALRQVFNDAEYFLVDESYPDALAEYQKLYKRGYDNANINYKIGVCYVNIPGEKEKAIAYLQKAVQNVTENYGEGSFSETKAPYDAYLYLGNAFRVNNQLENAILAYKKYKELLSGKKEPENIEYANQQIAACNNAIEAMKHPVDVSFTDLGNPINNSSYNYKPVVSADENIMAYMQHLPFYEAIYISTKTNGKWQNPVNLTPIIRSDGDYRTSSITADGKKMYLTREDNYNSDIYVTENINDTWTLPVMLGKNVNTKYWESNASVTGDGKTLYFASNRKGSVGGTDIFRSELQDDGSWGDPVDLGENVNTALNEDSPFVTEDGNRLYFSSQGHFNIGGYDIFYCTRNEDGSWSKPVNIGFPVNTTDDDIFFVPVKNGKAGYMARFEDNSLGADDIYRISFEPKVIEEPEMITEETAEPPALEEKNPPQIPVTEKEPSKAEKTAPEKEQEPIVIRSILFGFDSYQLTSQAKEELSMLADALKEHKKVVILITGHTDSRGPANYNVTLSLKRAQSVADYLKQKGIAPERLSTKGAGEENPVGINTNPDGTDNPEGRRYNRRVSFSIKSGGEGYIIFKPVEVPENLQIK
ncbi:MAG TPA: OmpA family protein [Bacteroidales bacterium]|nr:OmpA family protein [Bacteroidales bacterium]